MNDLVLRTSKGRSPIRLALGLEHSDILKFLVSKNGLSLLEEDLRMDYRKVLTHLKVLLDIVPASLLAQENHLPATVHVVTPSTAASSTAAQEQKEGSSAVEFGNNFKENEDVASSTSDSLPPPGNHLLV